MNDATLESLPLRVSSLNAKLALLAFWRGQTFGIALLVRLWQCLPVQ